MDKAIYQIKNLNHAIVRYCCQIGNDKENLPTPAQMQIIQYINSQNGQKVYQRDIARALSLRRATLSEILKTMERNDFISRINNQKDTRIKEIIISESAKEKFKTVKETLNKTEKALIQNIDKKDLETFFLVINQMQKNLKMKG